MTLGLPINGNISHTDGIHAVSNGIPRITEFRSSMCTNGRPDLIEGSLPALIHRRKVLGLQRAYAAASSKVKYGLVCGEVAGLVLEFS